MTEGLATQPATLAESGLGDVGSGGRLLKSRSLVRVFLNSILSELTSVRLGVSCSMTQGP